MNRTILLLAVLLPILQGFGQAATRKLPQNINRPTINLTAPFISLDGSTLLFTSDYAEDNVPTVFMAKKEGANWTEPKALPKHINARLNFQKGYTLSADGSTLYITTIRSGGVGGYDIWAGKISGASWGDLQNMYAPINSRLHEATPTFSPDGSTMYFMRCQKMDSQKAEGCKIMMTKKAANGLWQEPVELPSNINTGNSQTPRISADGTILIFSSNVISPNKGGMDLYVSRRLNDTWSDPQPLDFVNTPGDDQFVSSISNGRYLLKDAPGKLKSELVEFLVPEQWRPRAVMKLEGQILGTDGAPTPAYISVEDLGTRKRFFTARPDKNGYYFLYLTEGTRYELSVDPEQGNFTFFSKMFDMTVEESPLVQKVDVTLKQVSAGDVIELEGLEFKPHSALLDDAGNEIRRLVRLIKTVPDRRFEIQVELEGYFEDSLKSDPDLTEIRVDTIIYQIQDIDTLGQLYSRDSTIIETTYHNNRTAQQAQTLVNELIEQGIDPAQLSYNVFIKPAILPQERRTRLRVLIR
ncbi:MAG: PD40 domain-containing protein [Cyclobacteriaceae bacterium]|nr:PD40 domain-containing protein [Cyclobacteriaceae bacterium]